MKYNLFLICLDFGFILVNNIFCSNSVVLVSPLHSTIDDSVLSSDLSIELSHHEDQIPYLSFEKDQENDYEEDNYEEEDDELPSFLMQADNSERWQ